jgi:hypothetical protein
MYLFTSRHKNSELFRSSWVWPLGCYVFCAGLIGSSDCRYADIAVPLGGSFFATFTVPVVKIGFSYSNLTFFQLHWV